ncbi:c-type cytochrome [Aestuariivirga sp.]|uniref:c-type cytochrome n=1 Tax=Aestuariivirga sp. TaxID=2650926 RepID=UPI00391B44B0
MKTSFRAALALGIAMAAAAHAHAAEVSAERGAQVAITGGCHDCHTAGYLETGGKLDPAAALKGTSLGWQGPWGTTYPANLRLMAKERGSEDAFVQYAKTFKARPPMPYFNVHAMDEGDLRSLYQYLVSLGEPGDAPPEFVPPGQEPKTPYIVVAPPVMPKG